MLRALTGFLIRAPRHEDAEAVADLMRACDVANYGAPDTDVKDVRDDWNAPQFDLARDAWLLQGADDAPVGFASIRPRAERDFDAAVYVLPGQSVDALAPALLEAVEARAREIAAGPEASLCFFTASVENEMKLVLERSGYRDVRTFFRMGIDLEARGGDVSLPTGIEIRPLRLGTDDRAIHAVIEESFAEHFRHAPRPFNDWWGLRARHERFDPGLWLLAWEGERVAGALIGIDYGDIGFIRELGVLKPWRGRGVGSALLVSSFQSFLDRGQLHVVLGVDAENESAVGLYERIGMRVEQRHHLMRKRLPR